MQNSIIADEHGPLGQSMKDAVQSCVHCGFCLAACPTYSELGQEMDSPRGRIWLMKQVLEGELAFDDTKEYIDQCLGCLACEPACPSGVQYRELISPFRALTESKRKRSVIEKSRRILVEKTLPYPNRFRVAAKAAVLARLFSPVLPKSLAPMLELLPKSIQPKQVLPERIPAIGKQRASVALLSGCAQQVLDPDINAATIDVLTRNGVEVLIPKNQSCCGALSWHTGSIEQAQEFARINIAEFPKNVDAIITNAAGCGSGLHEYPLMLKGTPEEEDAIAFSKRVIDVSAFLEQLGELEPIPDLGHEIRIAYHDACHLANGQGIRDEPRDLLRRIPQAKILEIADPQYCCGSAGTYNIDQPEIAHKLGSKKATNALATKPDFIASGNIGCLTQLSHHLQKQNASTPARHTIQILRDAYCGLI